MEGSEQDYPPPMTPVGIALIAVGTGLVVFLAGVCVIVAVGKQVPSELWSTGSALSGGLLGILAPSPSSSGIGKVAAAKAPAAEAEPAPGAPPAAAEATGAPAAGVPPKTVADSRAKPATAPTPKIGELISELFKKFVADTGTNRTVTALLLVFGAAILVPLLTSAAESTELHALAAGSGAALLGMLASSPTETQK
jgi:hypothetical protein